MKISEFRAVFLAILLMLARHGDSNAVKPSFHFVLVHGAAHGGWCWYKVSQQLQKAGHRVDAPDLTSAGISRADAKNVRSLPAYSAPVVDLLQRLPQNHKVVLVGHSLAGLTLTYLLENFPQKISGAVYVAALMLPSGAAAKNISQQVGYKNPEELAVYQYENGNRVAASLRLENVHKIIYNLSPLEDIVLAKSLLRPLPLLDPAINFTAANYGSVPRYYIRTKHDISLPPDNQAIILRANPPTGILELDSDHSPFFSTPEALSTCLLQAAAKILEAQTSE